MEMNTAYPFQFQCGNSASCRLSCACWHPGTCWRHSAIRSAALKRGRSTLQRSSAGIETLFLETMLGSRRRSHPSIRDTSDCHPGTWRAPASRFCRGVPCPRIQNCGEFLSPPTMMCWCSKPLGISLTSPSMPQLIAALEGLVSSTAATGAICCVATR